ncbi:MAG: hypothetical protein MPJ78_01930 [Hyphomicrobiaceae bacterium]|nr:hypothetical protein [Hyphomicrobiaceae bacterium]
MRGLPAIVAQALDHLPVRPEFRPAREFKDVRTAVYQMKAMTSHTPGGLIGEERHTRNTPISLDLLDLRAQGLIEGQPPDVAGNLLMRRRQAGIPVRANLNKQCVVTPGFGYQGCQVRVGRKSTIPVLKTPDAYRRKQIR